MRTEIYTYFTQVGETRLLYSSSANWVRIIMQLETAGPVAVGQREELTPVLSGKGILLPTGEDYTFVLPPNARLFITSESINRVKFTVEPIPWLQQIFAAIESGLGALIRAVGGTVPATGHAPAVPAARGGGSVVPPQSSTSQATPQVPFIPKFPWRKR